MPNKKCDNCGGEITQSIYDIHRKFCPINSYTHSLCGESMKREEYNNTCPEREKCDFCSKLFEKSVLDEHEFRCQGKTQRENEGKSRCKNEEEVCSSNEVKQEEKGAKFRVNHLKLIQIVEKNIEEESKSSLMEYYLNICLMSKTVDPKTKFYIYYLKSVFHYKLEDYNEVFHSLKSSLKLINYINEIDYDIFLRQLYLGACSYYKLKDFLYSFYYFNFCQQIKTNYANISNVPSALETKIKNCIDSLNDLIDINRAKFAEFENIPHDQLQIIQAIFDNANSDFRPGTKVYLISIKWLKKAKFFWSRYVKAREFQETNPKFQRFISETFHNNKIGNEFISFFNKENDYPETYSPVYPGKIDNIVLLKYKSCWEDPIFKDDNVYLRPGLHKGVDFECLDKESWNQLNALFESTNEIIREYGNFYLNEYKPLILFPQLREKKEKFLSRRYIQISGDKTIKDFKRKILRSIMNQYVPKNMIILEDSEEEEDSNALSNDFSQESKYNIKFFLLPSQYKKMLFELSVAYLKSIPMYAIPGLKVEVSDSIMMSEFPDVGKKYALIMEVSEKKGSRGFVVIKGGQCILCKKVIKEEWKCDICCYSPYCSKECSDKDKRHQFLHSKLSFFLHKNQLKTPEKGGINDLVSQKERKDKNEKLVGMPNFGNTCYINSAIQCLSNTDDLTDYFLSSKFEKEVNYNNPFSQSAEFVKEYSKLVSSIKSAKSPGINTKEFVNKMSDFIRFNDGGKINSQQDCQEFLNILLDTLHEDLNRIVLKPHTEMKEEFANESSIQSTTQWWDIYKKREDSIIVDLFQGLLRTITICSNCTRANVTYDPFMFLELEIPKTRYFTFKYFYQKGTQEMNNFIYKNVKITLSTNLSVYDLIQKCLEFSPTTKDDELENSFLILSNLSTKGRINNGTKFQAVYLNKSKMIERILDDNEKINTLFDADHEVCVYQVERAESKSSFEIYIYPSIIDKEDTDPILISYPLILSVDQEQPIYLFYESILSLFQNTLIKKKFDSFSNVRLINLYIYHNLHPTRFFFQKVQCEFCRSKENIHYCPLFNFVKSTDNLKKLIEPISTKRPLILLCTSKYFEKSKAIYNSLNNSFDMDRSAISLNTTKKTIYDSLNEFESEEILEGDNKWKCSNCKSYREAKKKTELYKAPNYLIVHLKRFQEYTSTQGKKGAKKDDTFLWFPLENLDMRNYIKGPDITSYIFDLYAVVNHFGTLDKGHYTALCKKGGAWFECDDKEVQKINHNDVVTENAYLLFYKRKIIDVNN